MPAMTRRHFLGLTLSASFVALLPKFGRAADSGPFPVTLSDDEWKRKLSAEQYRVLREEGTEPAYTSPLNDEHRRGVFKCAGCASDLFSSEAKFDSRTGWPSFYQPISNTAVGTSTDYKILVPRTEVHCATCGGHLGHVFDDGPQPTGLRYCMNGVAMTFQPQD